MNPNAWFYASSASFTTDIGYLFRLSNIWINDPNYKHVVSKFVTVFSPAAMLLCLGTAGSNGLVTYQESPRSYERGQCRGILDSWISRTESKSSAETESDASHQVPEADVPA